MTIANRAELLHTLRGRCHTITDMWYGAIARASYVPHNAGKVRQQIAGLTEQAIALLLTNPLDRVQAQAIGASLAHLHCINPEVLGQTLRLLTQQLVQDLPAEQAVALQPRLATLLGSLATGFSHEARRTILAEQEQIRQALLGELRQADEVLREAYDKVEQCVHERTAELAAVNERLWQEIAEREQAQKALRESRNKLNSILSSMTDLVFAFDDEGRFTFHHSPHSRDLYAPPDNFIGKKHSEVMPLHLINPFAQAFEKNRKGEVAQYDYWLEIGDDIRWFSAKLSPVFIEGRFTGSVAVVREITKRKRVEEALWKAEETARALLNAPTDLTALIDTNGIILGINETAARRFDRHIDELVGSSIWHLFTSDVTERRKAYVDQVIQSGQPVRFEDEREGMWYDNIVYPILDAYENVRMIAILARDVTDRKRAEQALRQAHEELERRVKERTAELRIANEQLRREIEERKQTQEELVHAQGEVLRNHRLLLALSQAAEAVQRARTPDEVYRTIGEEVTRLGHQAMIFTLSRDREHLTVSHTTFEPACLRTVEELSGLSILDFLFSPAPGDLSWRVIAEGDAAFCGRTAELVAKGVPELDRPLVERLVEILRIEKSIFAPLRVGAEMHGILGVASTHLTEGDVPAITAFANQASIAIENAQLLQKASASRERLRQLTQQVISAQENERRHLSHALHDEAGQALTALKISLELIQEELPGEIGSLRQRIGDAAALAATTMEQIHLLAQTLRPPALDAVGLNPALEGLCSEFAKHTHLSINYLGLELPRLPEAVNICLYRFLQEALTNVAKHACASQVCVALRLDAETISLSAADDGRGLDRQAKQSGSGWPMGIGLLGMQERLESLDGHLEIESQPDQGTCLTALLPTEACLEEKDR
jgi:PAS domain S-box-containing protein